LKKKVLKEEEYIEAPTKPEKVEERINFCNFSGKQKNELILEAKRRSF